MAGGPSRSFGVNAAESGRDGADAALKSARVKFWQAESESELRERGVGFGECVDRTP